ncbi:glycosyltransferase [Pseudomonadales bacterium]|nr:glycosyltransferase [Pseudomonadales bacterium]
MHILIIPSSYPEDPSGVSGVFFRDQALALYKYGHKVGVISPKLKSLRGVMKFYNQKEPPLFENDEGILTYRLHKYAVLPRVPFGNYWIFRYTAKKLIKQYVTANGMPDIIHAHSVIYAGIVAEEMGRQMDVPVVITEHSTGFARKLYASWQLNMAERTYVKAGACIAVSPELGRLISAQMPLAKISWQWVPNVVADRFNKKKTATYRGGIRFLNLSLMTKKKGLSDLLCAFKKITDSDISAELWLGGDGPLRKQLEKQVEDLGLKNRVTFLGMVSPDEVPGLFEQVNIMVISSHYETFGVVAAEALMAGVPVVATRCGGPECIVQKNDGILVSPNDPVDLCHGMLTVARNIEDFSANEISERAFSRFSGEVIAQELTHIYDDLVRVNSKLDKK